MFVRKLVLALFVGAVLVGVTAGVSSAGGYKFSSVIPAFGPVHADLPAKCLLKFDSKHTYVTCTATAPNPDPPSDRETVKFTVNSPKGSCKLTAFPDGGVLLACTYKGLVA
jgi:hypothetical protein